MRNILTLVTLALVLTAAHPGAGDRLKVYVSPTEGMAPAIVLVQAIVEPASTNKELEVTAESEDFFRSSMIDLDGADAPRVSSFRFSALPAGRYEVTATVYSSGGVIATETRSVTIW